MCVITTYAKNENRSAITWHEFPAIIRFLAITVGMLFASCMVNSEVLAQTETAKTAFTTHYEPSAFPMTEMGQVAIGPLVPMLTATPHLFGNWGGIQPWLTNRGIFLNVTVNEEYMANITGGKQRANVLAGQVAAALDIDWQRLAGIPAFWTHMLVINGHGNSLSNAMGDSVTNPEEIYGARGNVVAHLVDMYADKGFLRDRIILSVGVIPTGSFFNQDYLACSFMNVSVCGNPAPSKYVPGGRDWPSGNIGAVLRVRPTLRTYIMGGIFAVSPHAYNGGISGWALGQDGLGKLSSQVEIGWSPSFGRHHLLGHYKIGYWYDNSRYPNLYADINGNSFQATGLPRRYEAGMNAAWLMFNQMIHRSGDGLANGLIVIGGVDYTQGSEVAMRDHEWIGLLQSGTPWGRPMDQIGVMFQYMEMSHTVTLQQESSLALGLPYLPNQWGAVYGIQSHENVWEAFYSIHVARGTAFQPDFQYLQRPGATTTFHDAAVVGFQFTTNL
ncbi:carbohydrate porin [Gluconacetobacter entanii]|uniref:Carbohydrate porin n=1 Tax=Gluconacetobacter entanii TaxID=108528 RepID=A0ABT3KA68_9PROT|nr:carbohydrate porin [Gluconacetobacter entanii]MBE7619791.1 carbohydrate porin [Komagataeibacter sp. FXV2]MCE2577936.1 carbohydrate porin [Komagataeibacter sp. FNDCR1]MCW4592332.1 carbohydrate porin [Gluconacetobacter entanii]MCW4595658.1 carbohydrate porin [Gluconacetobacter entanii]NPC87545.1 carbohydrate porin [Gluconacetobacter entanii]